MLRALLVLPLLLVACSDAGSPSASTGDPAADSAYALLGSLDVGAVAEAYARLDRLPHTVEIQLETLDTAGQATASGSRTLRFTPTADGLEQTDMSVDTSGAAPGGGTWNERLSAANPLPRILPDDPAFLDPRVRDKYTYSARKDTTHEGQPRRIVEARLRDDAGGEQALRLARYTLDANGAILSVDAERLSTSALLDETSRVQVHLMPGPGGHPIPRRAVAETLVDVPGSAPLRLRLTQRFRLQDDRPTRRERTTP